MAILVHWSESGALRRRLRELQDDVDPRSRKMDRLRTALKKSIVADNTEKILGQGTGLAGVDRYGRGLAPLGDWAHGAAFRRRGNGPVLAPRGLGSRVITNFRVRWVQDGAGWRMIAGWVGMPWFLYHLQGAPRGSKPGQPNWALPKRDVGGITPKGWTGVRGEFTRFVRNLSRGGS